MGGQQAAAGTDYPNLLETWPQALPRALRWVRMPFLLPEASQRDFGRFERRIDFNVHGSQAPPE